MNLRTTLIVGLAAAVLPAAAWAQAPCAIPFQSYLVDEDGTPSNSPIDIEVIFYDGADAGAAGIDCRVFNAVAVNNGWLNLSIDACSLPEPGPSGCGVMTVTEILEAGAAEGAQVYMALRLGDDLADAGPRTPLGAVPYAVYATSAQTAVTATSAAQADVAAELAGFTPADYATVASLSPVASSGLFSDLVGVPSGLGDGDSDTLGALMCAAGQVPGYDSDSSSWGCVDPAASGVRTFDVAAPPRAVVALEPDASETVPVGLLVESPWGETSAVPYDPLTGLGCDDCGTGADGVISLSATGLWPGTDQVEFHTEDFIVPEGVTITLDAAAPVTIRARRRIQIDGEIVLSGVDAVDRIGGLGRAGGTAGGTGGGGSGTVGLGGCYTSTSPAGAGAGRSGRSHRYGYENDGGGGGHAIPGVAGSEGGDPGAGGAATVDPVTAPEALGAGFGGGAGGTGYFTGGGSNICARGAGGGGGAGGLRLVAPDVSISGAVWADGGDGACRGNPYYSAGGGGGSGGMLWVQAWRLEGFGTMSSVGGAGACGGGAAGDGWIFIETYDDASTISTAPAASTLEYSRAPTGVVLSRTPDGVQLANFRATAFAGRVLGL